MRREVNSISNRLSLRQPQRDSLEILDRLVEILALNKDQDVAAALEIVKNEFEHVTDFEREFPSLCFALATGVGKTRLMGAFIAYLRAVKDFRHFFVLAPNLTIYNKLIADFTPNTPKYVFQGIPEFATHPPEIVTGENYESGRGVRNLFGEAESVTVNIFNISKIDNETRGGAVPRMKRLSEYIGESYFNYLAGLDDLVLIMDEAHRYRAASGMRVINELKPVLGLELTATPQTVSGANVVPFKNTIYYYPLSQALTDGFVKEPTVASRENFDAAAYTDEQLERLKLEDGIRLHENTKVALEVYAGQNDVPRVTPFVLVVAVDIGHAQELERTIKSDRFFGGAYKDKVITVHSNMRGEEGDDAVSRLLAVERSGLTDRPTEIVIHVNMLKEGWDVTNLYTIIPLRKFNSRTLVEQSLGRGLRLPYGKRTGNPEVDRLTIVAHDKFDEIIQHANDRNSLIRKGIVIGRDVPNTRTVATEVRPQAEAVLAATSRLPVDGGQQTISLESPEQRGCAEVAYKVVAKRRLLDSPDITLTNVEETASLVAQCKAEYRAQQPLLAEALADDEAEQIVRGVVELIATLTIEIPRVVVVPIGLHTVEYSDFDLDASSVGLLPVNDAILLHELISNLRTKISQSPVAHVESRQENYLVAPLVDYDDISYDEQAELLYKLAGQMVAHLRTYLKTDDEVVNVLVCHTKPLTDMIHHQMVEHRQLRTDGYEAHITPGTFLLKPQVAQTQAGSPPLDFRARPQQGTDIRRVLFGGFRKGLFEATKFDSDPERRFAALLEDDPRVKKWVRPTREHIRIFYDGGHAYEPDFIAETDDAKYICEIKAANEMESRDVLAKKRAALKWCEYASKYELDMGGKPWKYLLIPEDGFNQTSALEAVAERY